MKKLGAVLIGLMIAAIYLVGVGPPFAGATTTPTPGVVRGFFTSAAIPSLREGSLTYGSMDNQGNQRVILPAGSTFPAAAPAATYSASTPVAPGSGAVGTVASLCGSASKVVRVRRVVYSFNDASTIVYNVAMQITSTATTGGTAVALTTGRLDSTDGASALVVNTYPVTGPTPGSTATIVYAERSVQAATNGYTIKLDFSTTGAEFPTLRGTTQCFEVSNTVNTNFMLTVVWSEE